MVLLSIDSRDRDPSTDRTNARFTLSTPLQNVTSVTLVAAQIPHAWYNVGPHDRSFVYTSGGTSTTIILPVGSYTMNTLATAVALALNTAIGSNVFTVTASTLHYHMLLQSTSAAYSIDVTSQKLASLMGFKAGIISPSSNVSGVHTILSPSPLETAPNTLTISSPELGSGYHTSVGKRLPGMFQISVNENQGSVIEYNRSTSFNQTVKFDSGHGKDISSFHLHILDQNGYRIDTNLDYNMVWSIECQQ
jgi:hypothetical protein